MAVDTRFRLSKLQSLAEFLVQGVDIDAGLLDTLSEALPGKGTDKLLEKLDKLLQEPRGMEVLVLTLCFVLDEWLQAGEVELLRTNQQLEPFTWLATSDHLEVVQAFRQLL